MTFYIIYILIIILLYAAYLTQKYPWVVGIRTYLVEQVEKYSEVLSNFNSKKLSEEHKETYKNYKEEIDNITKLMIIRSLRFRKFYFSLLNPFMNNIFSQVKNKGLLVKILEENGEIEVERE